MVTHPLRHSMQPDLVLWFGEEQENLPAHSCLLALASSVLAPVIELLLAEQDAAPTRRLCLEGDDTRAWQLALDIIMVAQQPQFPMPALTTVRS